MKTHLNLKSFWLVFGLILLGSLQLNAATVTDRIVISGSATAIAYYEFPSGDRIYRAKTGTWTPSANANCGATHTMNGGSSKLYLYVAETTESITIVGYGSGSNRTMSTVMTNIVGINDTYSAIAYTTSGTMTGSSAGNCQTYTVTPDTPIQGGTWIEFTWSGNVNVAGFDIVTASTGPTLTAIPTTITDLQKNLYDNSNSIGTFTLSGENLIADATITAPTGFEISLNGTSGWATTQTVAHTAGSITDVPVYVRIASTVTTTGSVGPANITITSTDATSKTVAVSGEVVNLTPLTCPVTMTVDDISFFGATFTWNNVANNSGYTIKIYKAGVQVSSEDVAMNATSYNITGLDQLTAYTARLIVKGNGSTNGNSAECVARAFTTTKAPVSNSVGCLAEDFEGIQEGTNSTERGTNDNDVLGSGSSNGKTRLLLSTGTWGVIGLRGYTSDSHSGNKSIAFRGDVKPPSLETPVLDNPQKISFYAKAIGSDIVIRVEVGGLLVTDGVTVDGVAVTIDASGDIPLTATWHKIEVLVPDSKKTTKTTIKIIGDRTGSNSLGSSNLPLVDDVSVECSSSDLSAAPDAGGMNYVVDMGPSPTRTFTITANDLPNESGTITLNNLGNFQVSFDNGATWIIGTSASFPYSASSFAKSVMVRLKAGLSVNDYSTTVTVSCPGYTKEVPTVKFSGKVTLLPSTLPCGEEVVMLNMRGSDENNILKDYVLNTDWTAAVNQKNNHFQLKKVASLTSPTVSLSELDLKEISFYAQPNSASNGQITVYIETAAGLPLFSKTYSTPAKVPYYFSEDLSSISASEVRVRIYDTNGQDMELWDIKLTGATKRGITLSEVMLEDFESSSVDCKSDQQSFLVIGTCLVDDGNITFSSNVSPSQYEFSFDGTTWSQTTLPYTGKYPLGGKRVYVRQLGTTGTAAFNVTETITVGNNGIGAASIMLTGTVTPPDDMQIPASAAFSSPSGVSSIRSIPLLGGEFCQPLTVTHNCGTGLTLANCEGGTYGTSTSFAIEHIDRALYLKYTPGSNLSCTLTLKSGSFTATIPITWTGAASISNGVATDNTNVKYAAAAGFGRTNVWKAGTLSDATVVSIASAEFEVSMGNPDYGDFVSLESAKLGNLKGTLFIRQKGAATSGTITLTTTGGQTTTINVTVQ